jgi:hypothetical protein
MKRVTLKRIKVLLVSVILLSSAAFSQFENVDFLRTAPQDGAKFIEAYIAPWANAFGAGLNGSWYNTAKPHKFGGFDVTLGVNIGMVPASDKTFEISSLDLSPALAGTGQASTIAGPKNNPQAMTYSVGGVELATFETPPGTEWKFIPVPTLQVGIGLPLGTELKGRFIPRLQIKGGDIMLWGVGLMHSITQYLPGDKLLPVDASIFAGFTRLNGNVPLDLQPAIVGGHNPNYTNYSLASFNDQNLSATIDALNVGAIASINLKVITFYGGLGYSKTKTLIELTGYYPTPTVVTPGVAAPYAEYNDTGVKTGSDFGEINIENFSGLRANIGFRIKLAVITFYADYTRSQYNVVSAGLGVSFR